MWRDAQIIETDSRGQVGDLSQVRRDVQVRSAKPQAAVDVEVVEDDYDAVEIVDEVTAAREAKATATKPRRRPRQQFKKKSNPWPMILICVGSLLGVAVLGGGGYFAYKFMTTSRTGDPIAYMPQNAPLMVGADLRVLLRDTPLSSMIESQISKLPDYNKIKNDLAICDKMVIGVGGSLQAAPLVSVALTTTSPLNKDEVLKSFGGQAATIGGRSAYEGPSTHATKVAALFPTSTLFAVYTGPPNLVEESVRKGGSSNPSSNMADMVHKASSGHIWVVVDLAAAGLRDQLMAAVPVAQSQNMTGGVKCVGLWGNVAGSDLQVSVHLLTTDATAAKTMSDEVQKALGQAKSNPMMQMMVRQMGNGGPLIQEFVETAATGTEGATVTLTGRIKMSTLQPMMQQLMNVVPSLPGMMGGQPFDPRTGRPGGRGGR